jgi:hypothetical protein
LKTHRSYAEVTTTELVEIEAAIESFDPHLVICSHFDGMLANGKHAWVSSSFDSDRLKTTICLDGELSESENLELNELLSIMDGAERLIRMKRSLGNC